MSSADSGLKARPSSWRLVPLGLLLAAAPAAVGLRRCRHPAAVCDDGRRRPTSTRQLKQVDFAPIPGRVGQRIRNEMIFQTTGGGNPLPPNHRLEIVLKENLTSTLVRLHGEAAARSTPCRHRSG